MLQLYISTFVVLRIRVVFFGIAHLPNANCQNHLKEYEAEFMFVFDYGFYQILSESMLRCHLAFWRWAFGPPISSACAGQQLEVVLLQDPSDLE